MGKSKRRRSWPLTPPTSSVALIDNHTHLPIHEGEIPTAADGKLSVDQQLHRASEAGVQALITCGCSLDSLAGTVELTQHPQVWAALAIHPNEAALHAGVVEKSPDGNSHELLDHHRYSIDEAVAKVAELIRDHPRVVAVGETGLDYFRTSASGVAAQKEAFAAHIALAKELDLPLQIHDRQAHADTVEMLLKCGAPQRTVFHCFSGDRELAQVLADNGWYASFAGPLTYPANDYLREAAQVLPRELIMVETDAPYLTPKPYRGQPNASYLVGYTLQALAETRGEDYDALGAAIWQTTTAVYNLPLGD